jgi:Transglutaminase-like superfamily
LARIYISALLLFVIACPTWGQSNSFENFDFRKADSIAAAYVDYTLDNPKKLANNLTTGLETDVEKFRALYRWVCDNITNDYQLFQKNEKARAKLTAKEDLKVWNDTFSKTIFKTLREKKRTVCTGYAYLLRELCAHSDIQCEIIDGYGRTAQSNIGGTGIANHSWNAVKLNGAWYLCDPTWSSGAYDTQQKQFVQKFEAAYFLPAPSLFIKNHYPLDSAWMLLDEKPDLNTFLNRPLIYVNAYYNEVHDPMPNTIEVQVTKGETVSFSFVGKKAIEKTSIMINGHVHPEKFNEKQGYYTLSHQFKSKGKHVVHILANERHVLTYRIIVI